MDLLKSNNAYFGSIPKARTAKIVRSVLDIVSSVPDSIEMQIALCRDVINWCVSEKRTFLRQRIEGKVRRIRYIHIYIYITYFTVQILLFFTHTICTIYICSWLIYYY